MGVCYALSPLADFCYKRFDTLDLLDVKEEEIEECFHTLVDHNEVLNAPSDSTNVIVKLHIFANLPNVEAKDAKTWVKNLTQIKNAGLKRKILNVTAIAQGRTLKIHVRDIECSKVNSILLPALKKSAMCIA